MQGAVRKHLVEFTYLWGKTRTFGVTATVTCDERSKGNRQGDETGETALERGHRSVDHDYHQRDKNQASQRKQCGGA